MSKKTWYIATNTENLIIFIDNGLIFDKQGFFDNSYMIDAMEDEPVGYIPVFTEPKLPYALKKAREEDDNLDCCLLELDNEQIFDIEKNDRTDKKLIPVPLPFSCIKSIYVADLKTKNDIQKYYEKKFGIKKTEGLSFRVRKKLFPSNKIENNTQPDMGFEGNQDSFSEPKREINYRKIFSYGAALGLLYYQTKNGRESTAIFNYFENNNIDSSSEDKNAFRPLFDYMYMNEREETTDVGKIYQLLIDKLAPIDDSGEDRAKILSILEFSEEIPEGYKKPCKKLCESLKTINDRTNPKRPEEILKIIINNLYNDDLDFKNLALLLSMSFFRDNLETTLKFYHDDFEEKHYALLAIYFGLIYGVTDVPKEILETYNLSTWLSYKMAVYAQGTQANQLKLKAPAKPLLLFGDCIKEKPLRDNTINNRKSHDFYEWLGKKYCQPLNDETPQPLLFLKWSRKLPQKGVIENGEMVSEDRPITTAIINEQVLSKIIIETTKQDELFDFNEIISNYQKYTK